MNQTVWIIILSYVVSGFFLAVFCRSIARRKGYPHLAGYAFLGFFFNILGLIYVAGLPDLKTREVLARLAGQSPAVLARSPMQDDRQLFSGAEEPGVIAAITAAISMIWDGSGTGAAATVRTAAAAAPGAPGAAGFIIRQVRRV